MVIAAVKRRPVEQAMEFARDSLNQQEHLINQTVGGGYTPPVAFKNLRDQLDRFDHVRRNAIGGDLPLPEEMVPLVVAALVVWRQEKASILEDRKSRLVDYSAVAGLEEELASIESVMADDRVQSAAPMQLPQITDVLTLEAAAHATGTVGDAPERVYDDKFHILQAGRQVIPGLAYYRQGCALRGTNVGFVYVDIDNFKAVNTKHTEPVVDVLVLPALMRALDAAVYGRGTAYREGGDEYVMVLPSVSADELRSMLEGLRRRIRQLDFEIDAHMTVSVGYVLVTPVSSLTNGEVRERASEAKAIAKEEGRDRVVGFENDRFRREEAIRLSDPA